MTVLSSSAIACRSVAKKAQIAARVKAIIKKHGGINGLPYNTQAHWCIKKKKKIM